MDYSKIITKHCTEADRNHMLSGHFKIGTLKEYRNYESKIGTLSDHKEGVSQFNYNDPPRNFTGTIGNVKLRNVTMGQGGTLVQNIVEYDANVFCSSYGPYDRQRHITLIEGVAEYRPNPDMRHYVEIDFDKFLIAFSALGRRIKFAGHAHYKIKYIGREVDIKVGKLRYNSSEKLENDPSWRAIFCKPKLFAPECEFRIVFGVDEFDHRPISPIFTHEQDDEIVDLFRRCILSSGST